MSGGEVFVFDVRICQSYQMTIAVTIRQPMTVGWQFYCVVANLHLGEETFLQQQQSVSQLCRVEQTETTEQGRAG